MSFESEPIINIETEKPNPVEALLESQREKIERARALFHGESYPYFLGLNDVLNSLLEDYQELAMEESKFLTLLPNELFELIIGRDYVLNKEEALRAEGERSGIYLPIDKSGGGDFSERQEESSQVGQIKLLDFMGHGERALWPKALVLRMMELRQATPEAQREDLFSELDAYILDLPFPTKSADLIVVELSSDKPAKLAVETAGGVRLFTRRPDGEAVLLKLDPYAPLGSGHASTTKRLISSFDISDNTDIFLATDGLFDIKIEDKLRFEEIFTQFCEERKHLSGPEFKAELINYIKHAKEEGRVTDDVTVMALKVQNGARV